jgi:hypothetical protein
MNRITKTIIGACTAAVILFPATASAQERQGPQIGILNYGHCVASPNRGSIEGTPSPAQSGTAPGVALIDLETFDSNKNVGPSHAGPENDRTPDQFVRGLACDRDVGLK